jgi:mutual gliding-motility protein MglA
MPVVHHGLKELRLKLVYYGPGLGGKTTNLEYIHANSRPEFRGKLLSLATESERTLFFDLLPVELGRYKDYAVRLHLCTVPGQIRFDETRQFVLRHVDGIVFVVDSQRAALDANVASIKNLETNLMKQGDDPTTMPLVVQYNKRDIAGVLSLAELQAALRVPEGVPEVEASARYGHGVFGTLKLITRACLALVPEPTALPEGRVPSILPGKRASMFPSATPPALASEAARKELLAPKVPAIED